ncbi:MAG: DDE-type integrase/transposase/recombinase [Magnetovibrio sp.]|nr:DDE-type integrase/transposase/recombinase [Magnetovibrio sp.]
MDLFSHQIIGWSLKNNPRPDLVINALLMALWRRKPERKVLIHSDQGVQYTYSDWRNFLVDNNLDVSMNHRDNCHDTP